MVAISERLKRLREANFFTQNQVAEFLGVSRECVSFYENGLREIPLDKLIKLATFFGVEVEDFIEDGDTYNEELTLAFRQDKLSSADLESIYSFKKIIKNYLKMARLS